jgi:hypothetical protein
MKTQKIALERLDTIAQGFCCRPAIRRCGKMRSLSKPRTPEAEGRHNGRPATSTGGRDGSNSQLDHPLPPRAGSSAFFAPGRMRARPVTVTLGKTEKVRSQ